MSKLSKRVAKGVAIIAALAVVSSCGLPRSGPNKREIFSGSVMREGDAFVLIVDDRVNRIASVSPALGFAATFENAGLLGSDTIRAGDVIGITIWENVEDGLLVPAGQPATALNEIQVDGAGNIFVPYAGDIQAAGKSPDELRTLITELLQEQTPDPQVQVRRLAGDGSTVTVSGAVAARGVFPIERPTRTLSAMIAQAGGLTIEPEIAQVQVVRGSTSGTIWYEDLFDDPKADIALRAGDKIMVKEDSRSFTALGATGAQNRVGFDSKTISAIEAIATVGGLSTSIADPTGVFVFRNEPAEIANQLVGQTDLVGMQRVIYVLDLTEPNGMFMARDFAIRDGDTLYVTEAPMVQFNKTIAAFTGSLTAAGDAATAVAGN